MFWASCAPELLCLVLLAYIVCSKHAGMEFKAKWHVGDTPMDIQAAQGGHAKALGVLTGVYSRQDLEGCGAGDFAFSLGNTQWKLLLLASIGGGNANASCTFHPYVE